jgi:rhamnogalacturonan hydrolase
MKASILSALFAALVLPFLINAQLSGTVGPLTTRAEKAATKVCNILDYGGVASATTDNAAAITSAWAACVDGGEGKHPSLFNSNLADTDKSIFLPEITV